MEAQHDHQQDQQASLSSLDEEQKAFIESLIDGEGAEYREAFYGVLFHSEMIRERYGSFEGMKRLIAMPHQQLFTIWKQWLDHSYPEA